MDLEVTKGNVDNEMRERMNGQTINEICECCEEGIKSVMGINMQGMSKRWNKDLEGGNGIQKKAMRKWNE